MPRKQKTWKCPNSHLGEFQIDHVAITYTSQKEITNVKVRKEANIETDHYLTTIKLNFIPDNKKRTPKMKIPRIDTKILKLKKQESVQKLEIKSNEWQDMKEAIIKSAQEIAPLKKQSKNKWWNEICEETIAKRLISWKKWHSSKKEEDYNAFKEQRNETAKIIRGVKRKYEKDQLAQIEEDFQKNNTRSFYKTFKSNLKTFQHQNLCFRKENGELALNDEENCEILADYFKTLLNCEEPTQKFAAVRQTITSENSLPPNTEELAVIIDGMKNEKSPGEDGIVAEIWKAVNVNTLEKLESLMKQIWQTEQIPLEWKIALIHPIHKKGDKSDPNNYRGISLLQVTYKIFSKALQNRLEKQVDEQIGEYQAGFRRGRSCVEQIANLKFILRHRKLRGQHTFVTFVDFKKAYDSIDRETLLINTLREFKVDAKTTALIHQTLTDTESKVKFAGIASKPFKIQTGLRQGDGISCILFNCILEKVIREWRKKNMKGGIKNIKIGRDKDLEIDCLAFADDLAILSDNITDATKKINNLKEIAEKTGLQISFEKTEYITDVEKAPKQIKTKYGQINRVAKFKYLGEIIQPNGLDKEANKVRARKMETAFQLTRNIYSKKCLSINAKIRHYNTVIKPECMYASECLALNTAKQLEEIEKKERKIIRRILGPKHENGIWKLRSNKEIYDKIEKIGDSMRKRRVQYYGHLERMEGSRLTKKLFVSLTKTRRPNLPGSARRRKI
ncbi:hypothetical protein M8J77_010675 [Diaphorina citri]|nr:hypothetical protein M8J77_010675 [Diaphorina citri]